MSKELAFALFQGRAVPFVGEKSPKFDQVSLEREREREYNHQIPQT